MPQPATGVPIRIVTAAALFDGHDAAINIMRRILQMQGAEVVHLGHDRSVDEIVEAAVEEDADAVAISSYQGGHMEFFRYLLERLRACGAEHVRVYGGGGGTIVPEEIAALQALGVARIFSPDDGRKLGLEGMIRLLLDECREHARPPRADALLKELGRGDRCALARLITSLETATAKTSGDAARLDARALEQLRAELGERARAGRATVLGFTGPGGAGKSSVVDEVVRRLRREFPKLRLGLLLVDPTRRRSGGALLGDRIRLNSISGEQVFTRSLATRGSDRSVAAAVRDALLALRADGFELLIVETAGVGQSNSEIVDLVDSSVYVMTPEYGAPTQLEKIDMLEFADYVVLNKSDRRGAEDALRDVRRQWRRNHLAFDGSDAALPIYPTVASRWSDPGLEQFYLALRRALHERGAPLELRETDPPRAAQTPALLPPSRARHLEEVAQAVRAYHAETEVQAQKARRASALAESRDALGDAPAELQRALEREAEATRAALDAELAAALEAWPETRAAYEAERQRYRVRGRDIEVENYFETIAGTRVPRVVAPPGEEAGELARFLRGENLPGAFPFTAGVFPFKRVDEEPARMFAGEGGPERTNRRFHQLAGAQSATRLSTAFDSVTLYGRNPDERLDVYGKVGTSGVSVSTLDDAKKLYSGFDLCDPNTSVSMTINGPAPTLLAFFMNAAIDQQIEQHLRANGELEALRTRIESARGPLPRYQSALPPGHNGLGLGLLGIRGDEAVPASVYARIRERVLQTLRGTVQADILKEEQAQNTCIFDAGFSLKVLGDVQAWFTQHGVRNFYAISISGYHIAEAGANPVTQLAFTLANGFAYVEAWRARGLRVDDFAPNFSFFFSNGLDLEYNVLGRVARRIWAIAMRRVYGANERSQKLKYHVQTSGRSLHAQEMSFNDIRTTLQALTAVQDHCNSLHTNAYDEAVTTPTEESVRRALAIQLIINREFGMTRVENSLQGSYAVARLTDLVEEKVLQEFERLAERGGVLGAMETHYQRGKIQAESMHYESLKHSGALPLVGVNTFEGPAGEAPSKPVALQRATEPEKHAQLAALRDFHERHRETRAAALARLQQAVREGGNVFDELMETVQHASLGQISDALFEVGGRYRRAM